MHLHPAHQQSAGLDVAAGGCKVNRLQMSDKPNGCTSVLRKPNRDAMPATPASSSVHTYNPHNSAAAEDVTSSLTALTEYSDSTPVRTLSAK